MPSSSMIVEVDRTTIPDDCLSNVQLSARAFSLTSRLPREANYLRQHHAPAKASSKARSRDWLPLIPSTVYGGDVLVCIAELVHHWRQS